MGAINIGSKGGGNVKVSAPDGAKAGTQVLLPKKDGTLATLEDIKDLTDLDLEALVEVIDQVVLEFIDGTQAKLDHTELKDPLPTAPNKTWATMIQAFSNVKQITIVVDVNNVEQQTNKKVQDVLGKHFD